MQKSDLAMTGGAPRQESSERVACLPIPSLAQAVRSLLWIIEVQAHINSCAADPQDTECLMMASLLQLRVDKEWDALGSLVQNRPRPCSVFRCGSEEPHWRPRSEFHDEAIGKRQMRGEQV